jgi:hypothetical protein
MYGTVAHIRVNPGKEQEVLALQHEWERERRPKATGGIGEFLYKLDRNPNEYILVVLFQDKETYTALADDPEQDRWYRRFRELLEADPEWHDGEVVYSWHVSG